MPAFNERAAACPLRGHAAAVPSQAGYGSLGGHAVASGMVGTISTALAAQCGAQKETHSSVVGLGRRIPKPCEEETP